MQIYLNMNFQPYAKGEGNIQHRARKSCRRASWKPSDIETPVSQLIFVERINSDKLTNNQPSLRYFESLEHLMSFTLNNVVVRRSLKKKTPQPF